MHEGMPGEAARQYDEQRRAAKTIDPRLTDVPEPRNVAEPARTEVPEPRHVAEFPEELTEAERLAVVGIREELHKPEAFDQGADGKENVA